MLKWPFHVVPSEVLIKSVRRYTKAVHMGTMSKTSKLAVILLMISLLALPVYGYDKMDVANRLLNSYENVREYLLNVKGRVNETISQRIDEAISRADPLVEEAKQYISSGDDELAVEKLREALSILRDLLKDLKEPLKEDFTLMGTVSRLKRGAERARYILKKLEEKGVNITDLSYSLNEVDSLIEDAKAALISGNVDETKQLLEEARSKLSGVFQGLREEAKQHLNLTKEKVIRRVRFIVLSAEKSLARLDVAIKRLREANRTEDANKLIHLRNRIVSTLDSLDRHLKAGNRGEALEDVKHLVNLLRVCRNLRNRSSGA